MIAWQELSGENIIENIKQENIIYSLTEKGNLWENDLVTKSSTNIASGLDFTRGELWDDNHLIFSNQENNFSTFNLNDQTVSQKKIVLEQSGNWNIYGSRIYSFSPETNQILKITEPLSAQPSTKNWLVQPNEDISTDSHMIIDGEIWITSQNKIYRYFSGKDQHFEIKNLNEPLSNNIEIYREKDWPYLYILDKDNARLIVARNSGIVEKQFINHQLRNASDLIVNDDQNTAFMRDGNKILSMRFN